ncbi:hypothetical protein [Streptomyces sp. NBC_01262]|uniref:hypothetical protein n=1 Tax=Streptomyces sp. NBC_01262 TaxID=2903803 RepID=UPI002E332FDB|nr:hypothetical protein [Streptomyces sp. NBC_01262]
MRALRTERGVYAVANRQVSEAAGQGNNTAVGYHFGTKADLVRAMRRIMVDESLASPALQQILDRLHRCLADLPVEVHAERNAMARQLIVHMCAERERALAESTPTPRSNWRDAATGLIDAIVALWPAPVARRS